MCPHGALHQMCFPGSALAAQRSCMISQHQQPLQLLPAPPAPAPTCAVLPAPAAPAARPLEEDSPEQQRGQHGAALGVLSPLGALTSSAGAGLGVKGQLSLPLRGHCPAVGCTGLAVAHRHLNGKTAVGEEEPRSFRELLSCAQPSGRRLWGGILFLSCFAFFLFFFFSLPFSFGDSFF